MEQVIYERSIRYELRGEQYYPCFALPEPDNEQETYDLIVRQMAEAQGIDEELKARDQMAWVGAMNNIRRRRRTVKAALRLFFARRTRWTITTARKPDNMRFIEYQSY